ncbi:NADPH oxidoreductase A [Porphyridium purpureum]|uniref:NADPH oxidoreductase A n=1 Tax=Porphyridium purpureum TaxID=35688 RepID=A0A5J4Z3P3_PORPP|nr:NADPH oxidoreductase A [Porphyridium purpureum]|eukprot:POR1972..scf295_1
MGLALPVALALLLVWALVVVSRGRKNGSPPAESHSAPFSVWGWLAGNVSKNENERARGVEAEARAKLAMEQRSARRMKQTSRGQRVLKEALEFCPHDYSDTHGEGTRRVLVLYGTEYGFSKEVARKIAETLAERVADCAPRVLSTAFFNVLEPARENVIVMACSTTGDGVVPNDARDLHEAMSAGVEEEVIAMPSEAAEKMADDTQSAAPRCDKHQANPLFKGMSEQNKFAVIALGDRAYAHYCRGGLVFERLFRAHTSSSPLVSTGMINQEDWSAIDAWIDSLVCALDKEPVLRQGDDDDYLLSSVLELDSSSTAKTSVSKSAFANDNPAELAVNYTRSRPYIAAVAERRMLTKVLEHGDKETVHIEFDLGNSGLDYRCGDAVGVLPANCPDIVTDLLVELAANSHDTIQMRNGEEMSVQEALTFHFDLKNLKPDLLLFIRTRVNSTQRALLDDLLDGADPHGKSEKVLSYLHEREIGDVLADFSSANLQLGDLVPYLKPLLPRYYSISSAPRAALDHSAAIPTQLPARLAATVAVLKYETLGRQRKGVATTFLADRVQVGGKVPIFVSRNMDFRLPASPSVPVIMIGPGTGVAPFRAFLQERLGPAPLAPQGKSVFGAYGSENGASESSSATIQASNWLFFGCRHEARDFLYADELLAYERSGGLRLVTAFSRDQADRKVYVQDRLKEHGLALWKEIDTGRAHVYVCGDAGKMAADVHTALLDIFKQHGEMSQVGAEMYMAGLEKEHRYQRDVWAS